MAADLSTMLDEASRGWALALVDAEGRAAEIRERPIASAGTGVEVDERARNQREAEKLDRIAAAYQMLVDGASDGYLTVPQDVSSYLPTFMQAHERLIREATAQGRIVYTQ